MKLSDVDFMLTICPAVEHFAEVHVEVCAAVRRALVRVRDGLCEDVHKRRPDNPNFAAFHKDVGQVNHAKPSPLYSKDDFDRVPLIRMVHGKRCRGS